MENFEELKRYLAIRIDHLQKIASEGHAWALTADAELRRTLKLIDEDFARADTMAREESVLVKLRAYGAFDARSVARLEEVAE